MQVCELSFGSWTYNGLEVDVRPKNQTGDLTPVVVNVEWDINVFNASKVVDKFTCCPEPYPSVKYALVIERKAMFYILNILFPSLLLTLMSLLSFAIPSEAGEKVSFVMTLMLALAVFQLMIADSVPPSAETLPIISKLQASLY